MTVRDQEQANRERSQDLAWMATWHTTPGEAARRLGITRNALEKWASRNDRAVWERLVLNEQRRKLAS